MATIPDPTDIPRRIPDGSQPFATIGNAGAIESAVGDAAQVVIRAAGEFKERRDMHETASAKTGFMLDEFELVNSYDESEEYGTMVEDYDKKARALLGERAAKISSPRLKTRFLEEQELRIAQGRETIKDKAFAVETDFKRAGIVEQLEGLREMVIQGQGIRAMQQANTLIATGQDANYLGEQEGVELLQKFREDSAVAWIESIAPEQRLEALNSDLADNLPSDVRAKLKRQAETASIATKADNIAQEYQDRKYTREQMIAESDKIKEVRLQDEVKRRYDNRLSDMEQADTEKSSELHGKYFLPVRQGDIDVDEIPPEDLEAMSPSEQNNLFVAEGQSNGRTPIRSDRQSIDILWQLMEGRQWPELRRFFVKGFDAKTAKSVLGIDIPDNLDGTPGVIPAAAPLLSDSDYDTWSQRSVDGVIPDEYESLFTELKLIKDGLINSGYKGDNYTAANSKLSDEMKIWNQRIHKGSGKAPTDKMIEFKIDQLLMNVVTEYGSVWDSTDRLFEMSADQVDAAVVEAKRNDPEKYNRIINIAGIDPATRPVDFLEAYQRASK